jgi:ABC-2 type transport system ATP-binding protein
MPALASVHDAAYPEIAWMTDTVVSARSLRKSYGDREVVRGIELEIHKGEIFAFLGPNGAGKTTTVEMLEGYRARDDGEAVVLGEDPAKAGREWRSRIGVVLQTCTMPGELTVAELLGLYASYYPRPSTVDEVLELVGLAEQRRLRAQRLSSGQQRRLDVGLALIGNPELLFLDEPTTGFDPAARHHAWEVIDNLRGLGKTVFLTTHYMEEAQALADRVAVIAAGSIVSEGTPETLGGRDRAPSDISFTPPPGLQPFQLPPELAGETRMRDGRFHLQSRHPAHTLQRLSSWALERGFELEDLTVGRPTLEDVYLQLTEPKDHHA